MPASPRPHDDAGFSLVEMVVALTIIALASVMIVASLPKQAGANVDSAAEAVGQAMLRLADQAVATGRPVGVHVEADGLYPVVWQSGKWSDASGPAMRLEGGIQLGYRKSAPVPEGWPEFRIDPTGVYSRGEISVRSRTQEVTVRIGPGGPAGAPA